MPVALHPLTPVPSAGRFTEGEIAGVVIRPLETHRDRRGWLVELFRQDELDGLIPQMAYISQTDPGERRGPHEHVEQTDCFAFLGPGDLLVRMWDARGGSPTRGVSMTLVAGQSRPLAIIIPPGVVHGYRNLGDSPAWVFNAPDRLYRGPKRQCAVDEIRHEDDPASPFQLD